MTNCCYKEALTTIDRPSHTLSRSSLSPCLDIHISPPCMPPYKRGKRPLTYSPIRKTSSSLNAPSRPKKLAFFSAVDRKIERERNEERPSQFSPDPLRERVSRSDAETICQENSFPEQEEVFLQTCLCYFAVTVESGPRIKE